MVDLKAYCADDLDSVLCLFRETVTRVNCRDYSPEQIAAWLGPVTDDVRANWQASLLKHQTYLAWQGNTVVGFADMAATGYLDRLYVSTDHQGEGIATKLVTTLMQAVPVAVYTTDASITAWPFFEAQGFHVTKQNVVVRNEIPLINFTMKK